MTESRTSHCKILSNPGYTAGELPDFRQVSSSFQALPASFITRKIIILKRLSRIVVKLNIYVLCKLQITI